MRVVCLEFRVQGSGFRVEGREVEQERDARRGRGDWGLTVEGWGFGDGFEGGGEGDEGDGGGAEV